MRKLKYLLVFVLSIGLLNSCLIDNETEIQDNDKGANLVTFDLARTSIAAVADGSEYEFELRIKVVGPTIRDLKSDVVATIAADASSTAVAGTHYRLDNSTITLSASNNYLGLYKFTMLTAGIATPLDESPKLLLNVTGVTGDANVTNSGKPIEVTMNYACPSFLEGLYDAYMVRSSTGAIYNYQDFITNTGVGEYRTTEVGHWIGGLGVGTPGYTFYDVCNVITVPGQNLVDYYGNWVQGVELGSVDPATGVIHIVYSITSSGWSSNYDCTYTPAKK
jgi:hypothetical protein